MTVITGIPNYPQGKFYKGYGWFKKRREVYNGIRVIRIPIIPRGKNVVMLSLNYLSFVVSGFFWQLFTRLRADYVFIFEVSPMTQALPGVWYAKKRNIPCYLYVTDLWPENVEVIAGISNKKIINTIGSMVDYIYKRCDRIFTSSKSFVEAINDRGVPWEKLQFWPQYAEDYYVRIAKNSVNVPEIPQDEKFNIIFAGNIGEAQGLDILPETARILRQRGKDVRFNIVGDGRYKSTLVDKVISEGLTEMFNFINRQPSTRIPEFMAVCDAALISLSKNRVFSITLPAKTQSCLACGIPIIVSGDGEVQEVVKRAKAGVCSEAGNATELAKSIESIMDSSIEQRKVMANNAIRYYKLNFEKDRLLDEMDKWFG